MGSITRRSLMQSGCAGLLGLSFTRRSKAATSAATPEVLNAKWLKRYGGESSARVIHRKRFREMMMAHFSSTPVKWHGARNVWQAMVNFMQGPGSVHLEHGRYVVIDGFMPHFALSRGIVWIDTAITYSSQPPPVVFAAMVRRRGMLQVRIFTNDRNLYNDERNLSQSFRRQFKAWVGLGKTKYQGKVVKSVLVSPAGDTREIDARQLGLPPHLVGSKSIR